jgi:hypothetical protein
VLRAQMYVKFTEDLRLRFRVFERIRVRVESRDSQAANGAPSDGVTVEKFVHIQQRWTYTSDRTRVWLWKLDSSLPGRVGQIGDWLYRAEEKVTEVASQDFSTLAPAAAVDGLQERIDELKVDVLSNCHSGRKCILPYRIPLYSISHS